MPGLFPGGGTGGTSYGVTVYGGRSQVAPACIPDNATTAIRMVRNPGSTGRRLPIGEPVIAVTSGAISQLRAAGGSAVVSLMTEIDLAGAAG
jgi:hypothetical protein